MSEDALFAIHDWALGISPVTSHSDVKELVGNAVVVCW